ncbi:Ribosomal protein S2 family protein (apicoplast) [Theileria parva strain Muguga]|uniref:Ribosomal protein S2, putative n=1 Tax=Theileria parva TaxID=5875 RepID=Q4MY79_THEPA|nr:Ribosomal protein S2 family protein [Theileria parva strain Muguga]|eukprot:XP_762713.1 ribosomal protein S2 (apicoplast) [Theileria parva strain Muguga]
MKFLTFNNLLEKNIHISKLENIKKFDDNIYKIVNDSCIINLTYTSVFLYKLYKIFYILNSENLYVTIINNFKFYRNKFINLLLKFSNNNFFNSRYWVKGFLTNKEISYNILILNLWVEKFYLKFIDTYTNLRIPYNITKLIKKMQHMYGSLKLKPFSKFVFLLDADKDTHVMKECITSNKFLMGVCSYGSSTDFIDFYIYMNKKNEISLNFLTKFILIASMNGCFSKVFI